MRIIKCIKLKKNKEGLDQQPFPGSVGNNIFLNISKEVWNEWLMLQMKIINEYRLDLNNHNHRMLLRKEMKKFLTI